MGKTNIIAKQIFAISSLRNIGTVIAVFGFLLICFIWIGLHYIIDNERQIEIKGAIKDTTNFARAFEEHTLRTIRSTDQTVLFLKYQYEKEGRALDIPQYINEGRLANQPFVLLGVIDEQGIFAVSSQVPFVPSNLADREHFLVHKDFDSKELFVSKPVLGRSSGKWSIQMTRRANKPDGSLAGVVVVSVDPFYFTEFYRQVDLGKNSSITLVGLDGIVRARQSGENSDCGQSMIKSILMEKLADSESGFYIEDSTIDEIKRIHSYRTLKDYPFVVVVGVSEQEVMKSLYERIINYYWVATLVTVVIAIFIVALLGFTMRQKRAAEALQHANDNLEHKVEARTQELYTLNKELSEMNEEIWNTNQQLQNEIVERKNAQVQVIQQEKMASIGQLAAGLAHEINNPLGFVLSNFSTLQKYISRLVDMTKAYRGLYEQVIEEQVPSLQKNAKKIGILEKEKKLDYILEDLEPILEETKDGLNRVGDIVKALRLFSRVDKQGKYEGYNLNEGIKNSLIVARNEVKYIAEVKEILTEVPIVQAIGFKINQVLLNIILNATYAIQAKGIKSMGEIVIRTYADEQFVYCEIQDSGIGIPEEVQRDIFNPFFTTKPVGKGTGLGLSISYDTIVNKHGGEISFNSQVGVYTTFIIKLPIKQQVVL